MGGGGGLDELKPEQQWWEREGNFGQGGTCRRSNEKPGLRG